MKEGKHTTASAQAKRHRDAKLFKLAGLERTAAEAAVCGRDEK